MFDCHRFLWTEKKTKTTTKKKSVSTFSPKDTWLNYALRASGYTVPM
jgi:hypothetical protein